MLRNIQLLLFITFSVICIPQVSVAQTEVTIKSSELPETITTILKKKYKKYSVTSVKMKTDNSGTIYNIELQKKDKWAQLTYDSEGKLISKNKGRTYTFDGTEKPRRKQQPNTNGDGHNHTH